jgi:hypothetical protein
VGEEKEGSPDCGVYVTMLALYGSTSLKGKEKLREK